MGSLWIRMAWGRGSDGVWVDGVDEMRVEEEGRVRWGDFSGRGDELISLGSIFSGRGLVVAGWSSLLLPSSSSSSSSASPSSSSAYSSSSSSSTFFIFPGPGRGASIRSFCVALAFHGWVLQKLLFRQREEKGKSIYSSSVSVSVC